MLYFYDYLQMYIIFVECLVSNDENIETKMQIFLLKMIRKMFLLFYRKARKVFRKERKENLQKKRDG